MSRPCPLTMTGDPGVPRSKPRRPTDEVKQVQGCDMTIEVDRPNGVRPEAVAYRIWQWENNATRTGVR
jgi:hypothetical protein